MPTYTSMHITFLTYQFSAAKMLLQTLHYIYTQIIQIFLHNIIISIFEVIHIQQVIL